VGNYLAAGAAAESDHEWRGEGWSLEKVNVMSGGWVVFEISLRDSPYIERYGNSEG
jgi:hypothetical protein